MAARASLADQSAFGASLSGAAEFAGAITGRATDGLVEDGVITHPGSDQGARRNDYLLTEAGKDLCG